MPRGPSGVRLEEAFGSVLRALREERGLSQERLGLTSGTGRTFVSELERGEKGPSLQTLFKLSQQLGVSAAEMVRLTEERWGR